MHRREFLIRGSMGGIAAIGKFKKTPLETKTEKGPHHLNPELQKQFGYLEQELGKDFFEAILRLSSIQTTQERKLLLRPNNLEKLHRLGHSLGPTSNKALTLKERLEYAHLLVQRIKSGNFDKRYFPYEQKELCRQLDEYSANMFREFLTIGFAYMEKEDDEIVRFVLQKMIPNLNEAADKALEVQTTIIRQDKTRVE